MNWVVAFGWRDDETSTDDGVLENENASGILANPVTGRAYEGLTNSDVPGSWRLPTQRESIVLFLVQQQQQQQLSNISGFSELAADYWSSAERMSGKDSYFISVASGVVDRIKKIDTYHVRCVKDLMP